ncbi:MAG: shikimate dehydrogenase [Methylotenera sp.]|nr:shikimate dehydrogenase [Methylotenera sp.]
MSDKYAVIGNPIAHSKSPLIHEAFAKQTGQKISYERILAPLDGFEVTLESLVTQGYKGVNVTVPFKLEAYELCQTHTGRAFVAGASNTLIFNGGHIAGDNTDGAGLVNDIEKNLEVCLQGKQILLLGAGGAAQGVLQPLLEAQPKVITVANRNVDKAHLMLKRLAIKQATCGISVLSFEALTQQYDVIINATSAGLTETALPIANGIFSNNSLAYDMMYGRETPFMQQARENGAQVADGLGMLVEQAAEAFYIWRGVRPETQPVIAMLRAL